MTFWASDALESPAGRAAALGVGLLFGFWLERAGFGSSRKLAAVFARRDFAVVRVMFTAVATAAVGLFVAFQAGIARPEDVHALDVRYGPQIVGGLVFGVGFALGGWCPGTAFVGLASGKLDALIFLAGAAAGGLAHAAARPALEGLAATGAAGVRTLPEVLGISEGAAVAAVVVAAVVAGIGVGPLTRRGAPSLAADAGTSIASQRRTP